MSFIDVPVKLGYFRVRCENGDEEACRIYARTLWLAVTWNELAAMMILGLWPPKIPPAPLVPPWLTEIERTEKNVREMIPTKIWLDEAKKVREALSRTLRSFDMQINEIEGD